MSGIYTKILLITAFGFLLVGNVQASDANLSRTIDGMDIYMGITHANKTEENKVQKMTLIQDIKGKKHHVTVALFDNKSGTRITDVKVTAIIGEMGLSSNRKKLKPEKYGEAVSFGRDFYISKEGPYWIDLKIKRNGIKQATLTRFEWKHY
ncbi:MAG: hypothetical protein OEY52_15125 [Gammaproteobacteria bacterium]|nr:hypothetical protein [Gammaproteobacteria bacterium]